MIKKYNMWYTNLSFSLVFLFKLYRLSDLDRFELSSKIFKFMIPSINEYALCTSLAKWTSFI